MHFKIMSRMNVEIDTATCSALRSTRCRWGEIAQEILSQIAPVPAADIFKEEGL
jgi:hypothetical protein